MARLVNHVRTSPGVAAMLLLTLSQGGCEAESNVRRASPLEADPYLSRALFLEEGGQDTEVRIAPLGLRSEAVRWDGAWWITLDLAFAGPEEKVRGIANSLKYRFYREAPSLLVIQDTRGRTVDPDRSWYRQQDESKWIQFESDVFFKRTSDGVMQAIQPYRIAMRKAPRGGEYTVRLNADAIKEGLGSVNNIYGNVVIDDGEYAFELVVAELRTAAQPAAIP